MSRRLNLGCGPRKLSGFVNIDKSGSPDVYVDLETGDLPVLPETCDVIIARAFLAHISREHLPQLMQRIWYALEPGGLLFAMVPAPGRTFWSDPTHHTAWVRDGSSETMGHWTGRYNTVYGFPVFRQEWAYTLTRANGEHDAHSYWLRKPGAAGPDWRAVDAEIAAQGVFPNGLYAHHCAGGDR